MIELIVWKDACDFKGTSQDYKRHLPIVETIGFNVFEDDEKVILIHHREIKKETSHVVDEEEEGVCIPKNWIVERRELHDKKNTP